MSIKVYFKPKVVTLKDTALLEYKLDAVIG